MAIYLPKTMTFLKIVLILLVKIINALPTRMIIQISIKTCIIHHHLLHLLPYLLPPQVLLHRPFLSLLPEWLPDPPCREKTCIAATPLPPIQTVPLPTIQIAPLPTIPIPVPRPPPIPLTPSTTTFLTPGRNQRRLLIHFSITLIMFIATSQTPMRSSSASSVLRISGKPPAPGR